MQKNSQREQSYQNLKTHPWFKRLFKRINGEHEQIILSFIAQNDALNRDAFEAAVNRMFLDKPKPKNYEIVLELLANANISAKL